MAELRERIKLDFTPQGLGSQAAIDRAIEYFLKDSLSVHHPQCVAHLHCPSLVISQAAEVLINATNQSMDSWDQSPSATLIEMKLISGCVPRSVTSPATPGCSPAAAPRAI